MNQLRRAAVPAAVLLILGCAELHVPEVGSVQSVRMSPDTLVLRIGGSATVSAFPLDTFGIIRSEKVATWSSSVASVASVDDSGKVTAVAAGTGTIDATVDGVTGHTVVAVTGPPATAAVQAGSGQSAAVNSAVATSPAVQVKDGSGLVVPNAQVTFAVTAGGGSAAPSVVMTDFNGIARTTWTLGPSPGANGLSATVTDSGVTVPPVAFTATATVGPPSGAQSSVSASPSTISPSIGTSSSAITVTVRDANGSTITGATVTLSASGSGNLLTQPADTTNAQGQATGFISSATVGDKIITATINGSVVVTQTDTVTVATATPGLNVAIQPSGAVSNHALAIQPVVDIRDGSGNRILTASDAVTVTVLSGNGTLVGTTTVNAVQGRAVFSGLTIRGPRAGGDTLGTGAHVFQFSAAGYPSVQSASFNVDVSFSYNLADVFTRNSCTSACHGASFTFSHSNFVGAATTASCPGNIRIVANDTTNSFLYTKIRSQAPGCGTSMPQNAQNTLMSPTQIRLVRDWILLGAPNN